MTGTKTGPGRLQIVPVNGMPQQISRDVFAPETFGKGIPLIDDAADGDMPALEIAMRDVLEVTVSVGIVQSPVLAE